MKKNTVKKINIVFVSLTLALTVFFCSISVPVYASSGLTFDCPDCVDGTCTQLTAVDCMASGCVDGEVETGVVFTCQTCNGDMTIAGVIYETCSDCDGDGYLTASDTVYDKWDDATYVSVYYPCITCGGYYVDGYTCTDSTYGGSMESGASVNVYGNSYASGGGMYIGLGSSSSSRSKASSAASVKYWLAVSDGLVVNGTGLKPIDGTIDCPDCEDGTTYTTVISDCSTCNGTGELYSYQTITCPTCNGDTTIYTGIDNISTIPTVLNTVDTDMTVTFTFDVYGDIGDMEYIWYLNNNAYKVTETPSITLSELSIGVYGMYCEINSSIGFTTQTNQFELHVNPETETTYIQITQQPSSYTIKKGQAVAIQLDEENAENISWYVNDIETISDTTEFDLSTYDIGVYDIYCSYTINDETIRSEIATVSIVNDSGLTEEVESAWDDLTTGFWVAIGAALATALVAILAIIFKRK